MNPKLPSPLLFSLNHRLIHEYESICKKKQLLKLYYFLGFN